VPICAICGTNQGTTRDHVPPKSIFPKPRPSNLITVPACIECNNGASVYDDLFKVFLSLQATESNEMARRLFEEKTLKTLRRNSVLLERIKEESKEIEVINNDGELETRTGVLWDSQAHDAVIERTIRGLYFHHVGEPLSEETELSVQWLKEIPRELMPRLNLFTRVEIGDNQVTYKYLIYDQDPRLSVWLFDFYGAHWASGHTSPIGPTRF